MTTEEVLLANKRKNVDCLKAITDRFGITRQMPRTAAELTALLGKNPLLGGETVDDSGGSTWVPPEEVGAVENPAVDAKPSAAIPELELIKAWLEPIRKEYEGGIATSVILACCLGLPVTRHNEMKVSQAMKTLGYIKTRKAVGTMARQTVWQKGISGS